MIVPGAMIVIVMIMVMIVMIVLMPMRGIGNDRAPVGIICQRSAGDGILDGHGRKLRSHLR